MRRLPIQGASHEARAPARGSSGFQQRMAAHMITEITAQALNPGRFIDEKIGEIYKTVGEGTAINALSGGVDSSTVTPRFLKFATT